MNALRGRRMTQPAQDIASLLRGLDDRVPRYTSYPTADRFRRDVGEVQYRQAVAEGNALPLPPPLSIYVHVPFCKSLCYYCGCNKVVTRRFRKAAEYLDRAALNWQKTKKCATCHTNLFYMAARPALRTILPDSGAWPSSARKSISSPWKRSIAMASRKTARASKSPICPHGSRRSRETARLNRY